MRALIKSTGLDLENKTVLILGTGGTSKTAVEVSKSLGATEIVKVSRKKSSDTATYDEAYEKYSGADVIINTTPVGMFPHTAQAPELPYHALTERHLLYDLIYNPEETLFMRLGRERGATVKNGMEMLRLQALASWDFWNS